ncbi:MAG TPA: NAD(P)-binding domain-containing protein [Candidatus Thermoplasmatota archaeon]|nr:NAD(P)-binding domain-containing protein [Candidatus Thermoplasmatota archaeon]
MAKPKVGMIGEGNVGTALAEGLRRAGYEVETTGRDERRVREVASRADVIVLAVPFGERENAIRFMGADALRGKILVDPTNALTPEYDFAVEVKKQSGAEQLQNKAPEAKVVKAFNTVFADRMREGKVNGEPLSVLAAGDDEEAKDQVLKMAGALGFESVDAGPLQNARWLEAMGYLNIKLGYDQELGTEIGFRLVRV